MKNIALKEKKQQEYQNAHRDKTTEPGRNFILRVKKQNHWTFEEIKIIQEGIQKSNYHKNFF